MADIFSKISNPLNKRNTGGWTVNAGGGAYIDDWVTIGTNGGIYQGTGTPASPTTGLKIYNSSGIGLIEMWKAGNKTFYVDTNGDVTLSGTITATAGSIGGWTIGSGYLYCTTSGMAPADYPFYAGDSYANRASAEFRVSAAGALTATSATITGAITATSGSIGGFTIGASALTAGSGATAVGIAPATYPFYAGNATPASAPFRVTPAGALTATSVTIQAASGAVAIDGSGLTLSATAVADFDSIPAAQLVKFYSSAQVNNVAALGAWAYSVASPYMNLAALKSYQRTAGGNVYYASTRLYANAAYLNLHEATDASGGGITANVGIATSGALYVGSSSQLNLDGLSSGQIKATGQIISSLATGTAPLSVASTTKVTNLNADKWDSQDYTDWTDWTPTVYQSTTSVSVTVTEAKYALVGKVCHIYAVLAITGDGVAANAIEVRGVPTAGVCAEPAGMIVGTGWVYDSSATTIYIGASQWNTATANHFRVVASGNSSAVGAAPNIQLANGDTVRICATYRIA